MNSNILAFLLCFSLFHCQTAPCPIGSCSTSEEDEHGQLREVNCAVHLLSQLSPTSTDNFDFPLGHRVLCYMYDRYVAKHFDQVSQDSSSTQHHAEIGLNVTCKWVQSKENRPCSCTLSDIRKMCDAYRSHMLLNDFNEYVKCNEQTTSLPPNSPLRKVVHGKDGLGAAANATCVL